MSAGIAALPMSPAKLYVPSGPREAAPYALDTAADAMGCCVLDPAPEIVSAAHRPAKVPVSPASVSSGGKRSAHGKDDASVHSLRKPTGRNLQRRRTVAGVETAKRGQHAISKAEFGLPEGQQDVDEIRISVM